MAEDTLPGSAVDTDPLEGAKAMRTLDAGLARERTRAALFGETEVEHKISRFTILDLVGTGAMGIVYAAYDPDLDRKIAIKLVKAPAEEDNPEIRARMLAEARAMAKVAHPNVVSVFEVGITETVPPSVFVAMEFVDGATLREWVERDKPGWRKIVAAYGAAGRGLTAVHDAGLVHRDFKPDNAMIGADGRVRVMDFGLAHDSSERVPEGTVSGATERFAELTRTGEVVGTPAYMAPEQFSGDRVDHRSDQWAFCVALYEALWGKRPFVANSAERLAAQVIMAERPPEPPASKVPRRIKAAVLRGLQPEPDDRWPSLGALVAAISARRRGRWAVAWLGLGGAALAAGWVLQAGEDTAPACDGAEEAWAAAWGAQKADAVRNAFAGTKVPYAEPLADRVVASLDDYTGRWVASHRDACLAARVHHSQSDAMLDRRMRCLDRRRRDVTALVDALSRADADAIERAEGAVEGLVAPRRCGEPGFLDAVTEPPKDPNVARAVASHLDVLASIDSESQLGRNADALERARALQVEIDATGYGALSAEYDQLYGTLLLDSGAVEEGRQRLQSSYFAARRVGDAIVAATAANGLASAYITFDSNFEVGEVWLRMAEVEIEAHDLEEQRVVNADLWIELLRRSGRLQDAITRAEALVERLEAECGEACPLLPGVHSTMALLYASVSRGAESIEHANKGLEIAIARYGDEHSVVATALARLGDVLQGADQPEEARKTLERAVQMRERIFGLEHLPTAIARIELGLVVAEAGEPDEGLALMEDSLGAVRRAEEKQALAWALNQIATVYGDLGRPQDAIVHFREAADVFKALHPNGHASLAVVLSNLARESYNARDYEAAKKGFEEALAMRRAVVDGYDPQQGHFLLNLGNACQKLGHNDEAMAAFREAIALTKAEAISSVAISAYKKLAPLLPKTAAATLLAEADARCEKADAQTQRAADCPSQ